MALLVVRRPSIDVAAMDQRRLEVEFVRGLYGLRDDAACRLCFARWLRMTGRLRDD